ncbi:MAG TPA: OsmC family protein [Bacteroidales bacterium]|jgi:uncharacterized OsmC-like protein|nr:OsmC family protein [Bacteroidales bacterium]
MANAIFQAKTTLVDGLTVQCTARQFTITLDEPPDLGGKDQGMNPVECLLTALGACKCIVARAFAKKQGIRLKSVRIELDGVLDPDGFLGLNKDAKIGFSKITTKYFISADNTKEEVEQYIHFVERNCPVKDTIANTPAFETELTLE